MNVLHLIPSYLPGVHARGPVLPTHALNKELGRQGVKVTVCTTTRDGDRELEVETNRATDVDGVRVIYFRPSAPRVWQYSNDLHRFIAEKMSEFDVVHITSVFLAASTIGARSAVRAGVPYLISPHGSLMEQPLRSGALKKALYLSLLESRNLRRAAAVHFLVQKEYDEYAAAGLPPVRPVIIPNGVDVSRTAYTESGGSLRKRLRLSPGHRIVLFLGRIHWIKGLDTLIPAFVDVVQPFPDVVLVLAGPEGDGYRKTVRGMIADHRLASRVFCVGNLSDAEKWNALYESELFVLPSYTEACSVATIEAMLCGRPVVITDTSGLASFVTRSGAGLVVRKSVAELSRALVSLLSDPSEARAMGDRGRAAGTREFSIERVAENFLVVYNNLARKRQA